MKSCGKTSKRDLRDVGRCPVNGVMQGCMHADMLSFFFFPSHRHDFYAARVLCTQINGNPGLFSCRVSF